MQQIKFFVFNLPHIAFGIREKAVVTVRNIGNTIPAQEIPLLFERFHKSDKSRSVDKDGYGLGLYVVKTILNQHKEKITVTSENGVTAFSFTVQLFLIVVRTLSCDSFT